MQRLNVKWLKGKYQQERKTVQGGGGNVKRKKKIIRKNIGQKYLQG